jgi:hypothetical protein
MPYSAGRLYIVSHLERKDENLLDILTRILHVHLINLLKLKEELKTF